jgi:flagellar basal-body rod modification protein FlgD
MTSPLLGTAAPTSTTSAASATADRPDQMGSDVFLKLLVSEMKYQDPSNPMSSSDMMAQTATLTQTQSLQQIATQNSQLIAMQRSLSAGALVGSTVSYTDTDGSTQTGTVSAVRFSASDSSSSAVIGGKTVDVGRITQVGASAS